MLARKYSSARVLSLSALARRALQSDGDREEVDPAKPSLRLVDSSESREPSPSGSKRAVARLTAVPSPQAAQELDDAQIVEKDTRPRTPQQTRLGEAYAAERRQNQLNDVARMLREQVIRGEFSLPVLPAQALAFLQVGVTNNMEMRELERLVNSDPMVAARVLSLANSATFAGSRGSATTIHAACLRLGVRGVQDLLVQAIAETHIFGNAQRELAAQDIEHAVLVAALARRGADLVGQGHELAFTCGLLHDIGRPMVWHVLRTAKMPVLDLESRETLVDFLHPIVGERAARQWNLPNVVGDVARFHHCHRGAPQDVGLSPLVALVAAADRMATLQRLHPRVWAERLVLEEAWNDLRLAPVPAETWLSFANRLVASQQKS